LPQGPARPRHVDNRHADPDIFKRYNVRRDAVQDEAAERRNAYVATQRGTTPAVPSIRNK